MCSSEEEEETQSSLNPSFLRVRECGKIAHSLCVSRSPSLKCGKQGEQGGEMENAENAVLHFKPEMEIPFYFCPPRF